LNLAAISDKILMISNTKIFKNLKNHKLKISFWVLKYFGSYDQMAWADWDQKGFIKNLFYTKNVFIKPRNPWKGLIFSEKVIEIFIIAPYY
jgi:hypothetical protein